MFKDIARGVCSDDLCVVRKSSAKAVHTEGTERWCCPPPSLPLHCLGFSSLAYISLFIARSLLLSELK